MRERERERREGGREGEREREREKAVWDKDVSWPRAVFY